MDKLESVRQKVLKGVIKKESYEKVLESAQGRRFDEAKKVKENLIGMLDKVFLKWKEEINGEELWMKVGRDLVEKEFRRFYENKMKQRPSLMGYVEGIKQMMMQNQIVCLKGGSCRSQLFQLVVGLLIELRIEKSHIKMVLFTSKKHVTSYEFYQQLTFNEILKQITNIDLQVKFFEDIPSIDPSSKQKIIIFDIFSFSHSTYSPYLNTTINQKLFKHLLIHTQNQGSIFYDQLIELSNHFPCQIIRETKYPQDLLQIITTAKLCGQNADIIIIVQNPELQKQTIQQILNKSKLIVNIITQKGQKIDAKLGSIYIVMSQQELLSWNYNYYNVIAVFDSGLRTRTYFSIEQKAYVQRTEYLSQIEIERTILLLGESKPGKYFQMFEERPLLTKQYENQDLSLYIISMFSLGKSLTEMLENKTERIRKIIEKTYCFLEELKIINNTSSKVSNNYCYFISPIFNQLIATMIQSEANVLIYLIACFITPGKLKKSNNKKSHFAWKKSGDLSACIQILNYYQIKMAQSNDIPNLPELDANQHFIKKAIQFVKQIRNCFNIKSVIIYDNIDIQIQKVTLVLLQKFNNYALYSGSKRHGYLTKQNNNFILSKESRLIIFNERPLIILPLKFIKYHNQACQLLLSQKINQTDYLQIVGSVPLYPQKSDFNEIQLQFAGLSNATIQMLIQLSSDFETKFKCVVESNRQTSSIIIFCSKQSKTIIEEQFNQQIERIKSELEIETKIVPRNIWKLVLQKGGLIQQLLYKTESRTIKLINFSKTTTDEQIEQMLLEYANINTLQFKQEGQTKTVVIEFSSLDDLKWAVLKLDYTIFNSKQIRFIKHEDDNQRKIMTIQNSIKFKWYAWPLQKKGEGIVIFKNKEEAIKAAEVFDQRFDSHKVRASVNKNHLHLSGLNTITDETYLMSRLKIYGQIQDIQLQKVQTPEAFNSQNLIEYYIHQFTSKDEKFHINKAIKMANGLRICTVIMNNPKSIFTLCNAINEQSEMIGKTRLFLQPQYTYPIFINNKSFIKLYNSLIDESIKQLRINNSSMTRTIQQVDNILYIILKSNDYDALTLLTHAINQKQKGSQIKLNEKTQQIFFSLKSSDLINEMELQYGCEFTFNTYNKTLFVSCLKTELPKIIEEIQKLPTKTFEELISCSLKTYKHILSNPKVLEDLKKAHQLDIFRLQHTTKQIAIKGQNCNIIKAKMALSLYIQSLHQQVQNKDLTGMCGICCQSLNHPYKLQTCGHTFCEQCLVFSITTSFQDASMFPLKCPHCLVQICIYDINSLMDITKWSKLIQVSLNNFVNKNGQKYQFCFTPNCEGLCYIIQRQSQYLKQRIINCDLCRKTYCVNCQNLNHSGFTCHEAKIGTMELLKKFLEESNVRICPNIKCKMMIEKISGCNKVKCSRCSRCICWKCPKEKMANFSTERQCYDHLNSVHGGYT